ncbi:MAG: hydrogenase nickel insertion protein HypA [Thermoprotei archaeon]|nr:MAG: hydrogenase nickel insertion protein HypA [Thermoprotei archaeon]
MHEWALAEAIVKCVRDAIGDRGGVKEVCVVVGELQNIDLDVLEWALSELSKGTRLERATFKFELEKVEFACRSCGKRWSLSDVSLGDEEREAIHFIPELAHSFIKCPACGSPDFEVVRGRGVWIKYIKLEG